MIHSKSTLVAVLMASAVSGAFIVPSLAQTAQTGKPNINAVVPNTLPKTTPAPETTAPVAPSGKAPATATQQTPGAKALAAKTESKSETAKKTPTVALTSIPTKTIQLQPWSFAGIFGRYDQNQLRRGFKVFREVCSNCHSAKLLAFHNLDEPGGPDFPVDEVKALAATYQIADPSAKGGTRPGLTSDYWPSPFPTEQDARDANGGALPPDFSVLAKARSVARPFPYWIFDFFTTFQEGGPDYIHALMNGFHDNPPPGTKLPAGKYYNDYFPGHAISMPPPLSDGLVKYEKGKDGSTVPETVDQYSRDVAAYMMWVSDPGLDARKEMGFRAIIFLVLLAGLMWAVKRKIWAKAH